MPCRDAHIGELLNQLGRLVRWHDWGPSKIPTLWGIVFYIGLSQRPLAPTFTAKAAVFIAFAALHSALGYAVNDWGDRALDKLHGKPNAFASLSRTQVLAVFGSLAILSILSGLAFADDVLWVLLWLGWVFASLGYSLPPLRFKERGTWGLAASSVAQWSLPVLLTFAALADVARWDAALLTLALTISGATLEVAHQRFDRQRDASTHTHTLGSRLSAPVLDRLYIGMLLLDKLAWGLALVVMATRLGSIPIWRWSLSIGSVPLALYAILLPFALWEMRRPELLDTYYSIHRSFGKLLHETMPNLVLPAYLMIWATVLQPLNGLLLAAFLLWRLVLGQADWRWPLRILQSWRSGLGRMR